MKRIVLIAGGLLALGVLPGAGAAAEPPSPWLHVRVEEPGRQSRVNVNLPLNVVEVALRAAPEAIASKGRIHLGHEGHNLSIPDFRRIWNELKKTGDTDLVTVRRQRTSGSGSASKETWSRSGWRGRARKRSTSRCRWRWWTRSSRAKATS